MPDTVEGWAARAATLPAALVHATPDAVKAGAHVLEAASSAKLLAASGGDMRLSRVRSGRGAALKVSVRVVGAGARAQAQVVPTGPVMLLEADTPRHVQPFRYVSQRTGGAKSYSMARRRKATRRGLIYIPGLGTFQSVKHPGTKGKRPIGRAWDESKEAAGAAGVGIFSDAIRRHLTSN